MTASGGGSHGVPTDRSTAPPGCARGDLRDLGQAVIRIGRGRESWRGDVLGHDAANSREAGLPGVVEHDVDHRGPFVVGLVDDLSLAVHGGEHVAAVEGDDELHHPVGDPQPVTDRPQQLVDPVPGEGGDDDGVRMRVGERAAPRGSRSALLITSSSGTRVGVDLVEHRADGFDLLLGLGRRRVDDMDEQVGVFDHLEGGAEGLDQLVRELADEPDGVGQQHRLTAGQRQPPRPRVEGGEQAVLDEHARVGEPVEQRRLAGVGVAHEAHDPLARPPARPALGAAGGRRPASGRPRGGVMRRSSRRRSTSSWVSPGPLVPMPPACWRQAQPLAPQARQPVAQERQLHLGLAFLGAGVLGEDVEDHRRAVDGGATQDLLEVALLGR